MRAFRVAYDGREFHGFQRQPDVPTVEDALLDALAALDLLEPREPGAASRPVPEGYAAAGRTDAGVSALAQTVAFEAPEWLDSAALNAELPESVRAWASADVPGDFHATRDAERRRYVYYLHASTADVERARAAMDYLAGEHDLHNLTPDEEGTRRTLETRVRADGPYLELSVAAGGFPRELVRRIAGLVELVATGEREPAFVERVLDPEPLEGPDGVPAAPPGPLLLAAVDYPGVEFEPDEAAAADAREAFCARRTDAQTRALVAGRIEQGVGPEPSLEE